MNRSGSLSPNGRFFDVVLYLPGRHNLKEKRQTLKSMITVLGRSQNICCAETGNQNLWQKATITFGVAAENNQILDKIVEDILKRIEDDYDVEIIEVHTYY